ncbi:APC family permease [soil metagenome]
MASDATREGGEGTGGELERGISRRMLVFFIVGDMIGGGIYALVGDVGDVVGGAVWSAFVLALVLALFSAGAYAELSTKYPRAGGAATFVHRAFKQSLLTFVIAFGVICSGISSAAALAIAFGSDYFVEFAPVPFRITAIALIVLLSLINFYGIKESVSLNVVFTSIEVLGLFMIVVIGLLALGAGVGDPGRAFEFTGGGNPLILAFAGAGLAFYALVGFEDSVNVAEEVDDPRGSFPFALLGGVVIAGIIYFLVTLVAPMVVDVSQLAQSDNPLLEVVKVAPYTVPEWLFALIGLFALSNGALINMIMASRLLYGMAEDGVLPPVFGKIHSSRRTPWVGVIFAGLLASGLILSGGVEPLAATTVVLLLLAFIFVNVSCLVLRRDRVEHDYFRIPTAFPVLGVIVNLALLTQQEAGIFLRAGILLLIGAVLWLVNRFTLGRTQSPDAAPTA